MAKKLNTRPEFVTIGWIHANNSRKTLASYGDPLGDITTFDPTKPIEQQKARPKDALVELMYYGWSDKEPVTVQPIEHFAKLHGLTVEAVRDQVVASREALLTKWEANAASKELAVLMRKLWSVDASDVIAIANEAYRRSIAVPGVLYVRYKASVAADMSYPVPVQYVEFDNLLDELAAHTRENTQKDLGRKTYALLDYIGIALETKRLEGKEADLLKSGIERGTAQKAWGIAKLADKYPKLRLAERLFMEPSIVDKKLVYTAGGYVPAEKLGKEETRRLLSGFDYDNKSKDDKQKRTIVADDVERWFEAVVTGTARKPKAMSATDVTSVLGDSPVELVSRISIAINGNEKQFFVAIKEYAVALNEAIAGILPASLLYVGEASEDNDDASDSE